MNEEELNKCKLDDEGGNWQCPVQSCRKQLSRKQTLKCHISNIHDISLAVPPKRYKTYEYDQDAVMPRSTMYQQRKKENMSKNSSTEKEDERTPHASTSSAGYIHTDTDFQISMSSNIGMPSVGTEENSDNQTTCSEDDMFIDDSSIVCSNSDAEEVDFDSSDLSDSSDSSSSESDLNDELPAQANEEEYKEVLCAPLYIIEDGKNRIKSPISYMDHVLSVSEFATKHKISNTGLKHLLELIRLFIPEKNKMDISAKKFKRSRGFMESFLKDHTYCPTCKTFFSGEGHSCQTQNCSGK